MSYRIPSAPIIKILNSYFADSPAGAAMTNKQGQWALLAERAGVQYEWLEKVMYGRSKELQFNMCDQLMCAMGTVHLWRSPELIESYISVDLGDTRICCNPECSVEFDITDGSTKRYCSMKCINKMRTVRAAKRRMERRAALAV